MPQRVLQAGSGQRPKRLQRVVRIYASGDQQSLRGRNQGRDVVARQHRGDVIERPAIGGNPQNPPVCGAGDSFGPFEGRSIARDCECGAMECRRAGFGVRYRLQRMNCAAGNAALRERIQRLRPFGSRGVEHDARPHIEQSGHGFERRVRYRDQDPTRVVAEIGIAGRLHARADKRGGIARMFQAPAGHKSHRLALLREQPAERPRHTARAGDPDGRTRKIAKILQISV